MATTINLDFENILGASLANQVITFTLLENIVVEGSTIKTGTKIAKTLDANGQGQVELTQGNYIISLLDRVIPIGVPNSGTVNLSDLIGVTTPTPVQIGLPTGGTTNQVLTKTSNANYDVQWSAGGVAWADITGNPLDNSDLQTALDAKITKSGDTINGNFQNSTTKNTKILLSGDASGNDSQGNPVTNSTPRLDLSTSQISLYNSGDTTDKGGFGELIRLIANTRKAKPTLSWYDFAGKPIAWIVAHFQPQDLDVYANLASFPVTGVDDGLKAYYATDTGLYYTWNGSGYTQLLPTSYQYYYRAIHQHISIETADTTGYSNYTRLAIPYGLDVTPITTSSSHFVITEGTKSGKPFGAFILQKGNVYSYNPVTIYPNSANSDTVETWKDSPTDNIFANNTKGLKISKLANGATNNPVSGQEVIALEASGLNNLVINDHVVIASTGVNQNLGVNRDPGATLDVQRNDLGVANGTEYFIARVSRSDADGFLNLGYRGNGTGVGSYLIRSSNSKDLTIGTTGANQAITVSGANGDVTLASNFIVPQNKPQLAKISGGATQYGIPSANFITVGTSALTVNSIRYIPFYVAHPITLSQIQFEVTSAPASNANVRIGIYRSDSSYQPTTLVIDAGSTSVASAFTGLKNVAIIQSLSIGWHLIAVNCDVTMGVRTFVASSPIVSTTMGTTPFVQRFDVSSTFGAFAGTGVVWTTTNNSASGLQYPLAVQWS